MTTIVEAPEQVVPSGAPVSPPARAAKATRRRAWRRVALVPGALFVLAAVVGPWVVPYSPVDVVASPYIPPGTDHWFGTDSSGLDIFSRTVASARNNLLIGLATTVMATLAGMALGLLVGVNESRRGPLGLLARACSRAIDLVQAVPAIVIGLVLVAFFGASVLSLSVALAVVLTPNQARLVRTEVLRVRSEAYLDAARMSGQSELKLVMRHVLPNSCWPALENTTLVFGAAMVLTAALGFLGVGLRPPTPEWGSMMATGATAAAVGKWWPALFPALAIAGAVFALSAIGRQLFEGER